MFRVAVWLAQPSKTVFNAVHLRHNFVLYAVEDTMSIALEDVQLAQLTVLLVLVIIFAPAVQVAILCNKTKATEAASYVPVLVLLV